MKAILLAAFLAGPLILEAQDAKKIMQKARKQCASVKEGYYESDRRMKYMSGNDTFRDRYTCHFRRMPGDTIYGCAFHLNGYNEGKLNRDVLYTGNELVYLQALDSSASLKSNSLWAEKIISYKHNHNFYDPLMNPDLYPLVPDSLLDHPDYAFSYIGKDKVGDKPCHHIRLVRKPFNAPGDDLITFRDETHYWISTKDYLPLQYSIAYDMVMNGDTMYQFEMLTLTKYTEKLKDDSPLHMTSIPSHYKIKDYEEYKSLPPISDTLAPRWKFAGLSGDSLSLDDLKGKVVLVDFFYKSCYPCMKALPFLQSMHEKYKDSGVVVVGLDPYDKSTGELPEFLKKRGVSYPVLYADQGIARQYRVSGYPTLFLINGEGKIFHSGVGYGEEVDAEIEGLIKAELAAPSGK